jgi:predicted secreted hydrolase
VDGDGTFAWRYSERAADGDGNTASIHWMVREFSHGDTDRVYWIVSLVVMSQAACTYSSEQVFNNRVKVNR